MAAGLALVPAAVALGAGSAAGATGAQVYQWGKETGQKHYGPKPVKGVPDDVVAVQAGNWGGMALTASGEVWGWGHGNFGEFGNGGKATSLSTAVEAKGLPDIVSIGEGDDYAAAVDSSGNVWVWGQNLDDDLCLRTKSAFYKPHEIPGIKATAVQGGGSHIVILLADGTVDTCGLNRYGELGDGGTKNSERPVHAIGLHDVVAVSSGNEFSSALEADGSVWTWGRNTFGQLGDGTTVNADVPQQVPLPGPAAAIYDGGDFSYDGHMIVRLRDGTVMTWGNDEWGQLGIGRSAPFVATPQTVHVPDGVTFSTVAAGGRTSFAIDTDGGLWAWGDNASGDVGVSNRTGKIITAPTLVGNGFSLVSATADLGLGTSTGP